MNFFRAAPRSRSIPWVALATLLIVVVIGACQQGSPPPAPGSWSGESSSQVRLDDTQMPADHTVDWMRRHGAMAMAQGNDCAVCHGESDCIECHVESLDTAYAVHPPNYAVVHATDARQGLMDCTSCHRLDSFCETCHIEAGVAPDFEHMPPFAAEFHPPDWLDPMAPVNHGTMARRDINDCASCHIEQDCVSCHRGINPHPPEFHLHCDRYLQTDPTPCAQCHIESVDQLQMLCL